MDVEEHWQAWRTSLGDDGLISYRYLGMLVDRADAQYTAEGQMRVRHDLRTAGGLLAAPLGIALLDTAGINVDAIGQSAPTQIDVTVFDAALDVDVVRLFGEIVREGRTQMFTRARIEDAARPGRVIGFGTTSWAVMAPTPPGYVYVDPGPGVPDAPGPSAARRRVRRRPTRNGRRLCAGGLVVAGRRRLAPSRARSR